MKKPIVISVINQKGGVGKTTTTVNLGAGLAIKGKKVLVIDMDIQANLTHSLIGDIPEHADSVCEVLLSESPFDDIIKETTTKNLFIAPAGESLIELDINLANKMGREHILEQCLKATKCIKSFDIILIDNPPYVSLSTVNSLVASDFYIVPLSCEYLPMLGLKWLNKTVEKVLKLNPKLKSLGVALTMYDKREGITTSVEELVREELEDLVFKTKIRINTKHKSAPTSKQTIFQYEASKEGKGTIDYMGLTEEVLGRLGYTK